jgi:hypothetical protein
MAVVLGLYFDIGLQKLLARRGGRLALRQGKEQRADCYGGGKHPLSTPPPKAQGIARAAGKDAILLLKPMH